MDWTLIFKVIGVLLAAGAVSFVLGCSIAAIEKPTTIEDDDDYFD